MTSSRVLARAAGALLALCLLPAHAAAERQHTVRAGQTLISIAREHRVSVASLAAANARSTDASLRVGEVLSVPDRGVVVLGSGQSLWSVARGHGCSVEALARANGIDAQTPLRPGTRLVLPGRGATTTRAAKTQPARADSKVATSARAPSGRAVSAKLLRIATNERLSITLTDAKGRVRPQATARLARFLRPRHSTKQRRPDARLVALLAEVANHYPGRTIEVISGYRLPGGYTSKESRHTKGAAVDLRIRGVQNRALCDYLRRFRNVGVGLYPNSSFVHLDVRDKNAYWVDLSTPGWKPSYLDREQRDHFDGKNKDEGLVELGRSVEQALSQLDQEPSPGEPRAGDD